jgi:diguanylate cyclase (GGDEF)-like protein
MQSGEHIDSEPARRPIGRWAAFAVMAIACANIALALWMPAYLRADAIAEQTIRARHLAEQILTTRNYYINMVVLPLLINRGPGADMQELINPLSLPKPIQFALNASDIRRETETRVTIVSPYGQELSNHVGFDAFQQSAWNALQVDPERTAVEEKRIGGKPTLRIAVADRLTQQSCISCFNSEPNATKHDWRVGDIRAMMQVERVIEAPLMAAQKLSNDIVVAVAFGSLVVSLLLLLLERALASRNEQKAEADSKIRFLAFHDAMTGLLNRARFNELFAEYLSKVGSASDTATLLLVDLDHFKTINDVYGHAAGDEVIRQAADRLREVAGGDDLVARIGGDEFAVAQLASIDANEALRLADAIVAIMAKPFAVGNHQFKLSASVGVLYCPDDVHEVATLFKSADKALYKAKQNGRGCYAIYDAELDRALSVRRQIENRLKAIVDNPEDFALVYQPLCDVRHGEVKGFEALMRIDNCDDTPIPADVFIPIAEEMGLIAPIGRHILLRALQFAKTLPDPLTIAVNISPRQFFVADASQSLVEVMRRTLEATGFPAHRVELEITEGLFLDSTDHVAVQLQGLKELGVRLALDDFGVGYCSLGYLSKFPIDKLKIDRSFLSDAIERPKQIVPILQTIASLGRTLGLVVVAEGIETSEQAALAEQVGCHQLQGFYFCRPIDERDVPAYIECNRISTDGLKETGETTGGAGYASFWSRLLWTKTAGIWSPAISRAS